MVHDLTGRPVPKEATLTLGFVFPEARMFGVEANVPCGGLGSTG